MLDLYKRRVGSLGDNMGDALKNQSDTIMDKTFDRDIAYRICYIDGEPVEAKYIVYTYYSISKDAVDYHLQFRPGVHYPIGKYVDIPDDTKTYHRWLIVGRSDEPQFVKYNVLKCNWVFKWIVDGKIYESLGVLRNTNSYTSGLWTDYLFTTPDNLNKFIVPTNPITQTLNYNMRLLISDNQVNPIAWEVSKREDTFPVGITKITLKQDLFDPHRDNRELMIADYYKTYTTPEPAPETSPDVKISYSSSAAVKVGGSYKTFSAVPASEGTDISSVTWKVVGLNEKSYTTLISEDNPAVIKIKVTKDYTLIGKTFTLELHGDTGLLDSVDVEVIAL